jgi:hypothetical protein
MRSCLMKNCLMTTMRTICSSFLLLRCYTRLSCMKYNLFDGHWSTDTFLNTSYTTYDYSFTTNMVVIQA